MAITCVYINLCMCNIYIYIWVPVKNLYIWVVAIVMVTAFGGALSLSRVLWKSACSRSFHACIFLSSAFMSFHFPFMFLSLVFNSINFPFIFLSFSFQCAFMSPHLPFISTHFPFILHSCPFISFLKLRKWLYGLAKKPSATNGYR